MVAKIDTVFLYDKINQTFLSCSIYSRTGSISSARAHCALILPNLAIPVPQVWCLLKSKSQ